MTDFEASATISEFELASGEGRRIKQRLQEAMSPISIQGQVEKHGGGSPTQRLANGGGGSGRQRQRQRREHRWQRENNTHLEDILEEIRGLGDDGGLGLGGSGGGGGGMLAGLGGGAGGLLTTGLLGAGGVIGGISGWDMLTESPLGTDMFESFGEGDITGALSDIDVSSIFADQLGSGIVSGTILDQGFEAGGDWVGDNIDFEWPDLPSLSERDWPNLPSLSGLDWPDLPSLSSLGWPDLPSLTSLDWPDLPLLSGLDWPDIPSLSDLSWPDLPSLSDLSWPSMPSWVNRLFEIFDEHTPDLGGDDSSVRDRFSDDPVDVGTSVTKRMLDPFGIGGRVVDGATDHVPPTPNVSESAGDAGETVVDATASVGDTIINADLDSVRREISNQQDETMREVDRVEGKVDDLIRDIRGR